MTRHLDKPGAKEFAAWLAASSEVVEIGATEEFSEFKQLLAMIPARRAVTGAFASAGAERAWKGWGG